MKQPELDSPLLPAGVIVHRDIAYVTAGHPLQKLDLFVPAGNGPFPLIVWIHGGAFRMGDKSGIPFDPPPLTHLAQGYAVASLNYRLSQHATFPAQIEDCKAGVRWLRAHAAQYHLDPQRFGAWGPSAGGHLATMLGVAGGVRTFEVGDHLDFSSRVRCVVDYFGPTDFLQMDAQRLPDGMVHDPADSPESELIGGAIQEHTDAVQCANPITHVTSDAPPFLIVHGDCDPLVPHGQSVLLVNALQNAGVPVMFYTVKGAGHGNFDDPEVPALTNAFLSKHLKSS